MFIGHYALGFAAKRLDARPSLGAYFTAVQLLDLLWPVFCLLGLEGVRVDPGNTRFTPLDFYSYPYTHSLVGALVWSCLLFGVASWRYRNRRIALILGLGVLSHWVLDLVAHRPDLPILTTDGIKVGLSLWNSIPGTLLVEGALFAFGLGTYLRATRSRDRVGTWGLGGLVVFLATIWLMGLVDLPAPSPEAIAWTGNAQWLIVLWGFWVDRHRIPSN